MSIKIMTEVWESANVDQGTLLVLLALADSADDSTRSCYPGVEGLSRKSRLGERQVQYCIQRLRELGIVEVRRNASPVKTNVYKIAEVSAWDASRDAIIAPHGKKPDTQSDAPRDALHCVSETHSTAPKPSVTSDIEPSVRAREAEPTLFGDVPPSQKSEEPKKPDHFERFWSAYPLRKERKGAAAKFAAAVKSGVDPERIIAAAEAYAAIHAAPLRAGEFRPQPKHPTTWLNNGCWDDEDLKPAPNVVPIEQAPPADRMDREAAVHDRMGEYVWRDLKAARAREYRGEEPWPSNPPPPDATKAEKLRHRAATWRRMGGPDGTIERRAADKRAAELESEADKVEGRAA